MGMVARQAELKLEVEVPAEDEPLERWGSLIRWTGILYTKRPRRLSVPVKCGSCGGWRNVPIYDLQPASGKLNATCLFYPGNANSAFDGYTGLCRNCFTRLARPAVEYPDGTKLFKRERTKDGLPVFCGTCRKKGFLKCSLSEKLYDKYWDCPSCGQILGKWVHKESGATVFWLKRKEGQRNYVEFECAKCGGTFYCKDELPPRAEWWGLCPDDRYKHNPQRINDEKKPLPASDKFIDYKDRFGEGKLKPGKKRPSLGQYVKVPCPLPGCGRVNTFHFEVTRRDNFTGLCKPGKNGHTRDEIYLFLKGQAQNGNEQKNGSAKKKPGPEKGQYAFITWANMEEAFRRVDVFPTKAVIAKELGVTESGIEKWLRREKLSWKDVQRRFVKPALVPLED